jgi:GNAT superfamily N-acetyltransferase
MYTENPMKGIDLLPVQASEVEAVFELISTVAQTEIGMPSGALGRYRDSLKGDAAGQPGKGYLLCGRCRTEVAGVLICTQPEGGVATILWLIVGKNYRGGGLGSDLFQKACQWAKTAGCHKIKLTAASKEAVRFYTQLGMKVEGFHRDHWWHMDFWSLGIQLLPGGEGTEHGLAQDGVDI